MILHDFLGDGNIGEDEVTEEVVEVVGVTD
jgi:hypothetical protein